MTTGIPSTENEETAPIRRLDSQAPTIADGVQLLGEYEGSGYRERRYLVYRADEQAVLLTPLLYQVLAHLDGRRSLAEVAEQVNARSEQVIDPDGVRYLIEKKLEPLGLAVLHAAVDKPPVADPLLALNARGALLPARAVRVIARILAPLHMPPVVVTILGTLLALDLWMFTSGQADLAIRKTVGQPLFMLVVVGLLLASALFHESGHASGCHYGGARPGAIGFGLYVVFPCFYTNVTDAYRLNKAGRLRTDLGGIYFNSIFIVGLGCLYLATGYAPLLAAAVLVHAQILQQLLPTLRMDGYYIIADLVGVPNLFGLIVPVVRNMLPGRVGRHSRAAGTDVNLRPVARWVVTAWVLTVIPFLAGALALMVLRAPTYLGIASEQTAGQWATLETAVTHGAVATVLLSVFSILMLWLPWAGVGVLLARVLRRAVKGIARGVNRLRARTGRPGVPVG